MHLIMKKREWMMRKIMSEGKLKACKHRFIKIYRSTMPEQQCIFCGTIRIIPIFRVEDIGGNIQSTTTERS